MKKRLALAISLFLAVFALQAGERININKADAVTIAAEIKGVGLTKAEAIVKYRETNGPYKNLDDLIKVTGIGNKTLEKIREQMIILQQ